MPVYGMDEGKGDYCGRWRPKHSVIRVELERDWSPDKTEKLSSTKDSSELIHCADATLLWLW